jgi:hypothetical protein
MKKKTISKKALKFLSQDIQYQEVTLQEVKDLNTDWDFTTELGSLIVTKQNTDFIPKTNMIVRFYGKGVGHKIRGVVIPVTQPSEIVPNDVIFYYQTPEEEEEEHQKWCKEEEKKRQKEFEKNKKKFDNIYKILPKVFQERIDRFRANNLNFRRDYEEYELFCCLEALKIVQKLKTIELIDNWRGMAWDAQRMLVDIDNGHSGNTFSCSIVLAKTYLTNPENIPNVHGALCPLIGCLNYGCRPK